MIRWLRSTAVIESSWTHESARIVSSTSRRVPRRARGAYPDGSHGAVEIAHPNSYRQRSIGGIVPDRRSMPSACSLADVPLVRRVGIAVVESWRSGSRTSRASSRRVPALRGSLLPIRPAGWRRRPAVLRPPSARRSRSGVDRHVGPRCCLARFLQALPSPETTCVDAERSAARSAGVECPARSREWLDRLADLPSESSSRLSVTRRPTTRTWSRDLHPPCSSSGELSGGHRLGDVASETRPSTSRLLLALHGATESSSGPIDDAARVRHARAIMLCAVLTPLRAP